MRKKVLIVAPYCLLPGETGFNRFLYLAEFISNDYDVTLVTSSFRHLDKSHRSDKPVEQGFNIILIDEPGYKKNVSLGRLYSHSRFIINFKKWFRSSHDYDLVYSAYPLIETNIVLGQHKDEYGFKLIIDVQDIWPESISSFLPLISKLPLYLLPFTRKANRAYSFADAMVAVSATYLERSMLHSSCDLSECIYIGSDLKRVIGAKVKRFNDDAFRLIYIGTLSHSYDVKTVIQGVERLRNNLVNVELHILGGGPDEASLKSLNVSGVFFHGYVEYSEMFSFMKASSVAVNCLSKGASQSVTNKLSDYLSVGIPIINSQTNNEVLTLINSVDHANYKAGSVDKFVEAFNELYWKSDDLKFKPNPLFDRDSEYLKIKRLIDNVLAIKLA